MRPITSLLGDKPTSADDVAKALIDVTPLTKKVRETLLINVEEKTEIAPK